MPDLTKEEFDAMAAEYNLKTWDEIDRYLQRVLRPSALQQLASALSVFGVAIWFVGAFYLHMFQRLRRKLRFLH